MPLDFSAGDMTVHRIVELDAPFLHAMEMLPALTHEVLEENRHWLQPDSLSAGDLFQLCYQSYVVRTPHHNILIDSCLGNDKSRPRPEWDMKTDTNWMHALAAAGLGVEDIDYVMCTHLHGDHVGWNTRLVNGEWVPTFPRARYVFSQRELAATVAADQKMPNPGYRDSVLPVVQAGRAELVADDYQLGDHVRLLLRVGAPGFPTAEVAVKRPAGVPMAGLEPGLPAALAWQAHHARAFPPGEAPPRRGLA